MTDEQVERLLDAIRDLPPYIFVMIGLYAGLRREEILALQWDSVYLDTDTPYLTVRRAWHTEHNRPVISDELKTKAPLFSPASRSPQRCGRSGRSWSCSSPGRSTSSTSMSTAGRPKPAKICCGSGTLSTRVSRRQTASQRCWQNMAWNTSFSTGSAASRRTACCARAGTLPPGRTTMFS